VDSAKLNDWMQVVGIFALVASLVFVGLQMQQDQEIAIVEARGNLTATKAALADVLKDHGEIWQKGLDDVELSTAEHIEFLAIFEAVEAYYFTLFIRWGRFGRVDRDEAARAFAYAVYSHPGLRRARKEKLESWSVRDAAFGGALDTGAFHKSVDMHVEHLDSMSPSVESDRRYVFW
jgi:hypothetical protein